jgi:hypothetical protein
MESKINLVSCSFDEFVEYIVQKDIDFEDKMTSMKYINEMRKDIAPQIHSYMISFVKKHWIESNKEKVDSAILKIVEPFRPFVTPSYDIYYNHLDFNFDEEAYLAAADDGTVPTLPTKTGAIEYLNNRKKTKCCGCMIYVHPRLFVDE